MENNLKKNILLAIWLSMPVLAFYAGYLSNHVPSIHPTGFIQDDNVSYIAYARQYLDDSTFHWMYSNPLAEAAKEGIYFQPQTLLLALLLKTGILPGFCLVIFSCIFILICFYLLIRLFDSLFPQARYRNLLIWIWAWGGGLLFFSGLIVSPFLPHKPDDGLNIFFYLDPARGWWGLNFGRSLLFSLEAYYHALFLGIVLMLVRKKWWIAGALSLLLSLSHPFTGAELIGIVLCWMLVEKIFFGNKNIPWPALIFYLALLMAHGYYYLIYLPAFEEHRKVYEQYSLNWRLRYFHMMPAWFLVGIFAALSAWRIKWQALTGTAEKRLALCWLLVALLLANHELFTTPRQPVHFTRGYVYTGFFLIGVPGIQWLIDKIRNVGFWAAAAFFISVFSDNFFWIGEKILDRESSVSVKYLGKEEEDLLDWIRMNAGPQTLLISSNDLLPYLSTAYSPAYAWTPHPFTTPGYDKKKQEFQLFYQEGKYPEAWHTRTVWWIIRRSFQDDERAYRQNKERVQMVFENSIYQVALVGMDQEISR